jgi:hypothetical protein
MVWNKDGRDTTSDSNWCGTRMAETLPQTATGVEQGWQRHHLRQQLVWNKDGRDLLQQDTNDPELHTYKMV